MSLDSKNIHYGEDCLQKFKVDMKDKMLDALNKPEWYEDTWKRNFQDWLDS